eukprot:c33237_g1_i1.p1 GENE.c33237_g1_i1~~c33237_g1_i1.p1  ORF type:complete len:636 (-),score=133.07 c33237_g1_i1:22-1929(-)
MTEEAWRVGDIVVVRGQDIPATIVELLANGNARIKLIKSERERNVQTRKLARVDPALTSAAQRVSRLGLDVGGVISLQDTDGSDRSDHHNSLIRSMLRSPPSPECIDAVRKLVEHFGAANTYIVSKCRLATQQATNAWLHHSEFFTKTGFLPENVAYCELRAGREGLADEAIISVPLENPNTTTLQEIHTLTGRSKEEISNWFRTARVYCTGTSRSGVGKGAVCQVLGITHFVDDRLECLDSCFFEGVLRNEPQAQSVLVHFGPKSHPRYTATHVGAEASRSQAVLQRRQVSHATAQDWSGVVSALTTAAPIGISQDPPNTPLAHKPAPRPKQPREKQRSNDRPDASSAVTPCIFFASGRCRWGDGCRYLHNAALLNALEAQWLDPRNEAYRENLRACLDGDKEQIEDDPRFAEVVGVKAPGEHCCEFEYLVVLDLEGKENIIEIPMLVLRVQQHEDEIEITEVGRFHRWVSEEAISEPVPAMPYAKVLQEMDAFLRGLGLQPTSDSPNFVVVTCGDWDVGCQFQAQSERSGTGPLPHYLTTWINIKAVFNAHFYTSSGGKVKSRIRGMRGMLGKLDMLMKDGGVPGFHHIGMSDVENISRILIRLVVEGARFGQEDVRSRDKNYQPDEEDDVAL